PYRVIGRRSCRRLPGLNESAPARRSETARAGGGPANQLQLLSVQAVTVVPADFPTAAPLVQLLAFIPKVAALVSGAPVPAQFTCVWLLGVATGPVVNSSPATSTFPVAAPPRARQTPVLVLRPTTLFGNCNQLPPDVVPVAVVPRSIFEMSRRLAAVP